MILASMVALIGLLAVRLGTDVVSNIENRVTNGIVDAVLDVVDLNQQPQLSELAFGIRTLQKTQDEIKENQRREIKVHYKMGLDFMGYATTATNRKQKKDFIHTAIENFTYASNIEVGEAAVYARVLVGASFFALRTIDNTTSIDLENGEYEKAFQLAEKTFVFDPQTPSLRAFKRVPSRELIEQLLKIPHLQQKYGTFEVYWKKWEPPKFVAQPKQVAPPKFPTAWSKFGAAPEPTIIRPQTTFKWSGPPKQVAPPKFPTASPRVGPTLFPAQKICATCGNPFAVSRADFWQPFCPTCRGKNP